MTAPYYYLILVFLLAVALDLYLVRRNYNGQVNQRGYWTVLVSNLSKSLDALKAYVKRFDLATFLFLLALAIYLVTRLIGLDRFPIYFFSDEAIQSLSAFDLLNNGFRSLAGVLLPTYFRNGEYYNIGTSVYLQVVPVFLFGKSAVATRATSVFVTLIAAISIAIILRDVFKLKYWWTGTLFLSITPSWFLHSRTAFETAEFVAFYAGTLCPYLLYRYKSPRYLYLAIFLGALAFYTYAAAQMIVPLTALAFLLSDWRYHWEHRRHILPAIALAAFFSIPYWRFRLSDPDAPLEHLNRLFSYWTADLPLAEKMSRYAKEYSFGLSPWYWYIPNSRDLPRHLMKEYGHILIATLPLAVIGVLHVLRNLRLSAYRAVLIAILVSPAAAALVQTSITRVLVFVFLAAILTSLGLERVMQWIESHQERLRELGQGPEPTRGRLIAAFLIVSLGIAIAWISNQPIDRLTILSLTVLLALQISGVFTRLAPLLKRDSIPTALPTVSNGRVQTFMALSVFVILASVNGYMLNDSLTKGPLWFQDYGLRGMQYGAFQMFDLLEGHIKEHPETTVIFSPDWANGTDELARFFLEATSAIQVGSVRGHLTKKLPLDDNVLFVMTPEEFDQLATVGKFSEINVVDIVPYPNGEPGFYFVKLRYVDNIDEIFAAEKAVRQVMQEATFTIDDEPVLVKYTFLDTDLQEDAMALVFDGNPYTMAKTFEINPFVIEMTFPTQRTLHEFSIVIGSIKAEITLRCQTTPDAEPVIYTFEGEGSITAPELSFTLPQPLEVTVLRLDVRNVAATEEAMIHIWELTLR
jgi:4-amino-4-deoxy-L-arabinose transferase-like glycosyltransferase